MKQIKDLDIEEIIINKNNSGTGFVYQVVYSLKDDKNGTIQKIRTIFEDTNASQKSVEQLPDYFKTKIKTIQNI